MLKTRHTKKNTFPKDVLFVHFFDLRGHIVELLRKLVDPFQSKDAVLGYFLKRFFSSVKKIYSKLNFLISCCPRRTPQGIKQTDGRSYHISVIIPQEMRKMRGLSYIRPASKQARRGHASKAQVLLHQWCQCPDLQYMLPRFRRRLRLPCQARRSAR